MTPPRRSPHPRLRPLALLLCLAASTLLPLQAQTPRSRAPVTVNFVNADIEAVTRAFAAMIDRQIAVDPRVKGQITVYSEQPQSPADAYQNYLTALRGMGFAVVESGGLLKVVPEADAKLQTGTVSVGPVTTRGDQVITQIFQLRYENPNNLVAVLRPLISANNTINANPGSSSLVITDYAENLKRIAKIIAALDQPTATDLEIVPLEHAVAVDLAPLVQRLAETGSTTAAPGSPPGTGGTTVVADARSNSLIIRSPNAARLAAVRAAIEKLDRPSSGLGPNGGLWVVHLKNADAVKLAEVLRSAFSSVGGSNAASGSPGAAPRTAPTRAPQQINAAAGVASPQATAPLSSSGDITSGGFIQADPSTNSLIITAPEPLYKQVRAMIDQLDSRRAQLYIESMIVEVSGGDEADFGFQWQGLLGRSGDKTGVFAGTNLPSANGPGIVALSQSLAGAAGGATAIGEGLNIGLLRNYGGTYTLAAIARLLQTQTSTNIVSTPNLITLDNEEAKIVVGENVPFITGSFSNTGGSAVTSPFQTIERKDVGITLRIKPQIGENGTVRMVIYQEQSSVISTSSAGPSTTKRSIESQVVVDDGQIIVLGGLIEDRFVETQSKIPLLGDIPYLGALFRSEGREKRRTNLMVFLRPTVLRDADASNRISSDRYEQMRTRQEAAQPSPNFVLPVPGMPLMPELPTAKPTAPPPAPLEGTPANPKAP